MTKIESRLPEGFTVQRLSDGVSDFIHFRFPRTGGRTRGEVILPMDDGTSFKAVEAAFKRAGGLLPGSKTMADLVSGLISAVPDAPGVLARSPGWIIKDNGRAFVTPTLNYGSVEIPIVFHAPRADTISLKQSGTLEGWQANVAKPARRSIAVATALLASLSGPLFRFSELTESFVVNIAGNSSSGKSTANRGALSVWGEPTSMNSWNASDRGAIEQAFDNNDLVLVLDDIEQSDPNLSKRLKKALELLHQLVSGKGKRYAKSVKGKDQLPDLTYNCVFLSSSPSTLLSLDGPDSDIVRLLEIAVPHGDKGGIWHECSDPKPSVTAKKSDDLTRGAKENHGVAGDLWLRFLVAQDDLPARIQSAMKTFEGHVRPSGSLEARIAKKAGLLYAAAILAVEAKILPWNDNVCLRIASDSYDAFLASAFAGKAQKIGFLRSIVQLAKDRKKVARTDGAPATVSMSGAELVGCAYNQKSLLAIKMAALENLVPVGPFDADAVFKATLASLRQSGVLQGGSGNSLTKDVRFKEGNLKMAVFDVARLNDAIRASMPARTGVKSKSTGAKELKKSGKRPS